MALTIIHGTTEFQEQANALADRIGVFEQEGTAYIGFVLPSTPDTEPTVDLLLISRKFGLVLFGIVDVAELTIDRIQKAVEAQDQIYFAVKSYLMQSEQLRNKRELSFTFGSVSVVHDVNSVEGTFREFFVDLETVGDFLASQNPIPPETWNALNAVLDNVTQIKPPRKRPKALTVGSLGTIMKEIERQIANMDKWQRKAALEIPEGPQRIRGLAGSGKTVVLARKAALLHRKHRDWTIVVTFHTRSLYQQFVDLIRRFSFEYMRDEPDWSKLRVMHTWGSFNKPGVYSEIATSLRVLPRDFAYAAANYGSAGAFGGICEELLSVSGSGGFEPIYDAVLIDEAQDLPVSFFKLLYDVTKEPKRIVWAYDEMQNLMGSEMPTTIEMFGLNNEGEAKLSLDSQNGEADRDLVLPVCYRNTQWAITTAHALGIGVYHESGSLIQHFRDPNMWTKNGYRVHSGQLERGQQVSLERDPESYPEFFGRLLSKESSVQHKEFPNREKQYEWVADQIMRNVVDDELEFDDILVVFLNASTARKQATALNLALTRFGLRSHLVGFNTSQDEVFKQGSIAMAHIFRAKGNEAAMVYVVDAQDAFGFSRREAKRNALFTAITRSRAWVRICGYGEGMRKLELEMQKLEAKNFRLEFVVPSQAEQDTMRTIQSEDITGVAQAKKTAQESAMLLMKSVREGRISFKDLPSDIREQLRLFTSDEEEDADENL
jgi:superfamily I DNA and RNA helicase